MGGFWQGKHVVVTGGAGFLGSHLVPRLEVAGASVFVPRFLDYDLRSDIDVKAMFEHAGVPDVLFHLAATVGGIGANRERPADFLYDNALMNLHIVRHCHERRVKKLVCVGSVCAYPKFCPVPFIEENLWSGYPEETNAPYGVAKRALLVHLQAARQQYGLNGIYLIPTNLYGPGEDPDPKTSHVIPALIRKVVRAKEDNAPTVTAWGTGNATRDFLYVGDCADALLLAAEHYDEAEPVNLGSGDEVFIAGLLEIIKRLVGYEGETVWDTSKPDGQPRRKLNTNRARFAFGWQAATPLEEGLRRTIEWWRKERRST